MSRRGKPENFPDHSSLSFWLLQYVSRRRIIVRKLGKLGKTEDYSVRPRTLGSGAICCRFRRFQSSSVTICIAGLFSTSSRPISKQRKKLESRTSKLNDVREWRRKLINRYLLFGSRVSRGRSAQDADKWMRLVSIAWQY